MLSPNPSSDKRICGLLEPNNINEQFTQIAIPYKTVLDDSGLGWEDKVIKILKSLNKDNRY